MTTGELHHATLRVLAPHILLCGDGDATMTEKLPAQTFSVDCGQSSRLVRARRHFILSYLRLHDFADVRCDEEDTSLVFSMTGDGRHYLLRVSQAWLVASTHARVEERLDRLHACRRLREYGGAYLDVSKTGEEVLNPSLLTRSARQGG